MGRVSRLPFRLSLDVAGVVRLSLQRCFAVVTGLSLCNITRMSALSQGEFDAQRRFLLTCMYSAFKLLGTLCVSVVVICRCVPVAHGFVGFGCCSDRQETIAAAVPADLMPFVPQLQTPSSALFTIPTPAVPKPESDGADADVDIHVDTSEDVTVCRQRIECLVEWAVDHVANSRRGHLARKPS
jgi:hypothetical protein